MDEPQDQIGLSALAAAQQAFLKRWEQDHPRDNEEFQRELYELIALTYREAQAPLLRHLSEMAGLRAAALDKP